MNSRRTNLKHRSHASAHRAWRGEKYRVSRGEKHRARRGAMVVAVMFFLLIGGLMGALVLNWAELIVVQRTLAGRADAIALAATPSLLDPGLLAGLPPNPSADFLNAESVADQYRVANNNSGSSTYDVAAGDLTLTAGHLLNATLPPTPANFVAATPYDVLRVDIDRTTADGHPVTQLITSFWNMIGTDVTATSFATVDNRLVGFRPTAAINAPVLPIAIDANAWATERTTDGNGNGILEMEVRLACTVSGVATANGVVIGYDGPVVHAGVINQINDGLGQSDLPGPNHELGQITSTMPQTFPGEQPLTGLFCDDVKNALSALAAPNNAPPRVFPLYDAAASSGGNYVIVGFVAARILQVTQDADSVMLVVEPCYMIHTTAWIDDTATERNPFIYKLSLLK